MSNLNNKKDTVLITGASTGIGYELAKVFAKNGFNLILVARNEQKLNEIKDEFHKSFGIETKSIPKDLSLTNSAEEIYNEIKSCGIEVNILINNAGIGACGLFHTIDAKKDSEIIQLNILSLTTLTKLFANDMIKKGGGKILNVASTGSYQPGPYIAVYYASKAYVLSFSEALSNELKPYGITVSALCPGATKTEFSKNAGKSDFNKSMTAKAVAEVAYKGLIKNKKVIIPGFQNKVAVIFSRIIPRSLSAKMVRKFQENLVKKL